MKTKIKLHFFILLVLLNVPARMHAQGTAFTYQGRLTDNASPANGSYDLKFYLRDAPTSGNPVGTTNTIAPVPVSNGLFTVTLDFGAGVFTGPPRWLEIGVRTNGSVATHFTLSPRQALTPSPYATYAANATTAGTASSVASGTVVGSLNGLRDTVTLQAGNNVTITPNGSSLTIAAAGVGGSGIWTLNGNNTYYNAGNVGLGTTTPSAYGHGGTAKILQINNSGTTLHSQAHLILSSGVNSLADSAIGSVTWAQPGGMAAFIGAEARSTTPASPAAKLTFGTRNIGDVSASTKMVVTEDGNVGIGTTAPSGRLQVAGDWDDEQGALQLSGHRPTIRFTGDADVGNQSWLLHLGGSGPGNLGFFRRTGPGAWSPVMQLTTSGRQMEIYGQDALGLIGFQPFLTFFDTSSGNAASRIQGSQGDLVLEPASYIAGQFNTGLVVKNGTGFVGIGTTTPVAKLHAETSLASTAAVYGNATGAGGVGVYGQSVAGAAVHAEGNATQARDKGGFVKAMAYIDPFLPADQYVVRSYNSQPGATITVTRFSYGQYTIDFGFNVQDRFISVTPQASWTQHGVLVGMISSVIGSKVKVIFETNSRDVINEGSAFEDSRFHIIVY